MFPHLPMTLLADTDNSSTLIDQTGQDQERWSGASAVLHFLLPLASLIVLWGRRDILTRILLQIDRNCIAVCCPSLSKREKLLRWASENLPTTWSSPCRTLAGGISDLWRDGSLLCTLINMAIPGACPNPMRHWKKPPLHAQALAFKYLNITPVFTNDDFTKDFSSTNEQKFLTYLHDLQQAIQKYNSDVICSNFTPNYLAKGMGLQTGEQNRKTTFFVYSNATNPKCNNILIYIRGPYGTRGTATIPAFYNLHSAAAAAALSHEQIGRTDKIKYANEGRKKSFLQYIALDFTSFVTDKRSGANDIRIHVEMESDRAKVTYIPDNFGIYEVNLISNGEIINGSPFTANIVENTSGVMDTFERSQEIFNESPVITKKRVVCRFIDCISEKIRIESDNRFSESAEKSQDSGGLEEINEDDEDDSPSNEIPAINVTSCDDEKLDSTTQKPTSIVHPFTRPRYDKEPPDLTNIQSGNVANLKSILIDKLTFQTSPVCPDHTVPEVKPPQTLTERRRDFTKTLYSTRNSSISDKENEDVSNRYDLQVMNLMETIKRTTNLDRKPNTKEDLKSSFLKTREYWNNISCGTEAKSLRNSSEIYRSADDILATTRLRFVNKKLKKYSSLDECDFEVNDFMSIEDRKKILLRDQYELEKQKRNKTSDSKNVEATAVNERAPTQFKRTVEFFKNLENSKLGKSVSLDSGQKMSYGAILTDDEKFSIPFIKVKTRKRKSLKSIFDVNY